MTGETTVCETQTFYCVLFPVYICPQFVKFCDLNDFYCQYIFLWPGGRFIRKISRKVLQCPKNTQPPTMLVHQLFPKQRYSIIFEIFWGAKYSNGNQLEWLDLYATHCDGVWKKLSSNMCLRHLFWSHQASDGFRRKLWDLIWEQLRFSGRLAVIGRRCHYRTIFTSLRFSFLLKTNPIFSFQTIMILDNRYGVV